MKTQTAVQYTIRNVPRLVDKALRRKAAEEKKSLNAVLVGALKKETGISDEDTVYDDLDYLIGSWISDPNTEAALAELRTLDAEDWK